MKKKQDWRAKKELARIKDALLSLIDIMIVVYAACALAKKKKKQGLN